MTIPKPVTPLLPKANYQLRSTAPCGFQRAKNILYTYPEGAPNLSKKTRHIYYNIRVL